MPPMLQNQLALARCPHCAVAQPQLQGVWVVQTANHSGQNIWWWRVYKCATCGGLATAKALADGAEVIAVFPESPDVEAELPEQARAYLSQAVDSIHAPAGAVMLSASAVDAMLKAKGLVEGTLYSRIRAGVEQHILTPDMEHWAHNIRLDANDQRHADADAGLPTEEDARRCVEFAAAIGTFLFTLPARVQRGLADSS